MDDKLDDFSDLHLSPIVRSISFVFNNCSVGSPRNGSCRSTWDPCCSPETKTQLLFGRSHISAICFNIYFSSCERGSPFPCIEDERSCTIFVNFVSAVERDSRTWQLFATVRHRSTWNSIDFGPNTCSQTRHKYFFESGIDDSSTACVIESSFFVSSSSVSSSSSSISSSPKLSSAASAFSVKSNTSSNSFTSAISSEILSCERDFWNPRSRLSSRASSSPTAILLFGDSVGVVLFEISSIEADFDSFRIRSSSVITTNIPFDPFLIRSADCCPLIEVYGEVGGDASGDMSQLEVLRPICFPLFGCLRSNASRAAEPTSLTRELRFFPLRFDRDESFSSRVARCLRFSFSLLRRSPATKFCDA
mmetsp:Transcript_5931/g.10528  ORF Transcript_5931/g.10528 Transcript_5931/m.10528 type:complete len:363 (+) Transcript_5931:445-1533(+)